jgi:hypothetical protein
MAEVDFDLACAVALGIVECNWYLANVHQLNVFDRHLQPVAEYSNWLQPDDPLHQATRDYLVARNQVQQAVPRSYGQAGSWSNASQAKTRELSQMRANEARNFARQILHERGVITRAKSLGLKLFL